MYCRWLLQSRHAYKHIWKPTEDQWVHKDDFSTDIADWILELSQYPNKPHSVLNHPILRTPLIDTHMTFRPFCISFPSGQLRAGILWRTSMTTKSQQGNCISFLLFYPLALHYAHCVLPSTPVLLRAGVAVVVWDKLHIWYFLAS